MSLYKMVQLLSVLEYDVTVLLKKTKVLLLVEESRVSVVLVKGPVATGFYERSTDNQDFVFLYL